jgi:hypothetical protein
MLSGAKVEIDGTDISAKSEEGFFTLSGVKPGNISVVYTDDDFETIKKTIKVTGDVNSGGEADVALSPKLKEKQFRAILKWGAKPLDLDAYAKWSTQKVFSGNTYARGANMQARLVTDATNGYGPEVLFMKNVGNCKADKQNQCDIRYEINDPKGAALLDSKAEVSLYSKKGLEGTYKISDCKDSVTEDGKWWHVFTINGKNDKVKWECTSGEKPPPAYPVPKRTGKGKGGKGGGNRTDDEIDDEEEGGFDLNDYNPFALHAVPANSSATNKTQLAQIAIHGQPQIAKTKSALQVGDSADSESVHPITAQPATVPAVPVVADKPQTSLLGSFFGWLHTKAFGSTPATASAPDAKPAVLLETANKAFRSSATRAQSAPL